jgi:hypothetical protein
MVGDAAGHLAVQRLGGGDVDDLAARLVGIFWARLSASRLLPERAPPRISSLMAGILVKAAGRQPV